MTEMTCASGVDLLMDYLEGELTADVRSAIDVHVAGCPRCTAFIASYRATPRILREATVRTLPDDLKVSLHEYLRKKGLLREGGA